MTLLEVDIGGLDSLMVESLVLLIDSVSENVVLVDYFSSPAVEGYAKQVV